MLNENKLENDLNQVDTSKEVDSNMDSNDLLDDDLLAEGEGVKSLKELRRKQKEKSKFNSFLYVIAGILFILLVIVFGTYYFLKLSLSDEKLTGYDKDYVDFIGKNILSNDTNTNFNEGKNTIEKTKNMKAYISNTSIMFYSKKQSLDKFLKSSSIDIKNISSNIEKTKANLIKYKYLPKELSDTVKDIRLIPILSTLGAIKIYVLDYVYIKTNQFDEKILKGTSFGNGIESLSSYASLSKKLNSKKDLKKYLIEDIIKLREQGAKSYLDNKVFNYMYDNKNSFDKLYYIYKFYQDNKKVLDKRCGLENGKCTNFGGITKFEFIQMYISLLDKIYTITNKKFNSSVLKNSLPVDINLLVYDPKTKLLSFNISLSLKEGIQKVSVISLTTDIITLLRESRLIIGKNINFDKLEVKKVISRDNGKQVYNTVKLLFKTKVQSDINVEVTDAKK